MHKRLWNWMTISDCSENDTSKVVAPSVFKGFPAELYAEVFQYLDVESLKKCKGVCLRWNTILFRTGILCENSIYAWNGNDLTKWDYFKLCYQLMFDKIRIESNGGLRLKKFQIVGFCMVVSFSVERNSFFQHVTHVELAKMELVPLNLTEMVSKLKNLKSLELNNVSLIETELPEPSTANRNLYWEKIKSLKIYVAENWELNTLHHLTTTIFGTYCTRLENFALKMFDTGELLIDRMRPFQNVFGDFHNIVHSNAKTLKTVSLDTFSLEFDRNDKLFPKKYEGADESHNYTFQWFLTRLAEHTDWEDCGLKLENLSLHFRLANTRDTLAHTTFLPFLRTQTALKKFKMAQVYLPVAENTLEILLNCLPPFCHSLFEGVLTVRPPLPAPPGMNNLALLLGGHISDSDDSSDDDDDEDEDDDDALPPVVNEDINLDNDDNDHDDVLDPAPVVPPALNQDDDEDDEDSDGDDDILDAPNADADNDDSEDEDDEDSDGNDDILDAPPLANADAENDDSDDDEDSDGNDDILEAPPLANADGEDSDGDDNILEALALANADADNEDSDDADDSDSDDDDENDQGIPPVPAAPNVNGPWPIQLRINPNQPRQPPLLAAANLIANTLNGIEELMESQLPEDVRRNRSVVSSGYFDSSVELKTVSRSLTLRFLRSRSLTDINFLTRNMKFLTQIKIQEVGVKHEHKIMIGDAEIQTIITRAMNLKDLWLEYCDLHTLSDYGLTGIAPGACQRMLARKDFGFRHGDLIGVPISSMQKLRSLKLSDVGNQITDVSAYHAFNGLHSLSHFGISHPKMTSDGFKKIRDLFKFNQAVRLEIRTKILLDQFSPPEPMTPIGMDPLIVPDPDPQIVAPNHLPD